MKIKIFSLIASLVLTLGLSSCHDDNGPVVPTVDKTGTVNLKSMGIDVSNAENIIEVSRASIDLSDYVIQIYNAEGALVKDWTYNVMPDVFELPVGTYTAKVSSHEVQKAEWERPYFVGEKSFEILEDEISDLGIVTCTLGNIKVSVRFTDTLRKYLGDDVKVTVVANDQGLLEFTPAETRSGYFEALDGSSTLIAEFTGTVNGYYESKRLAMTDVAAGQHIIITYSVKLPTPPTPTDPTGGIDPSDGINLDVTVEDEDLRFNVNNEEEILEDDERPGGQEPDTPKPDDPKPENTISITSQNLSFEHSNNVAELNGVDAIVDIAAPKGISHFLVKIESSNGDFIASAGELLPLSFDLAYPGASASDFESIGFPTGDNVIDRTELKFDITQFVPLLAAFPGTHTFTLTVQDNDNQQIIKSLIFIAQ